MGDSERYCVFCGVEESTVFDSDLRKGMNSHHIVPESMGGRDVDANQIDVCDHCHRVLEETQVKAMKRLVEDVNNGLTLEDAAKRGSYKAWKNGKNPYTTNTNE